jgi:hypothetical protein
MKVYYLYIHGNLYDFIFFFLGTRFYIFRITWTLKFELLERVVIAKECAIC